MDNLVLELKKVLKKYKLHSEDKWFFGYYVFLWKRKKLLFYINPPRAKWARKDTVVFGMSHWATTILRDYPMLKVAADEVMISTIKWKLKEVDDIKKRWIEEIIKIGVNYYKERK